MTSKDTQVSQYDLNDYYIDWVEEDEIEESAQEWADYEQGRV